MFKKIKKNATKIEFTQEAIESTSPPPQQPENGSESIKKPNQRVMFEEDYHEPVVSKRIRLIPNIPLNAKPVVQEKQVPPRNYSYTHLMDLEALNQKDNIDAREHMSHQTIQISDEEPTIPEYEQVRQYMDEQLGESDDDSVKDITQKVLKQKQLKKKQEEFISFSSQQIDQNWIQDTDNRRIPVVGAVKHSFKGEYDSLPSGSDDEEFQSFEQSIINNNASSKRRAQVRSETLYQESGFKQFSFNSKTQHQGGDSRLMQKIQTLSYTSVINDADNALQVDQSFIKRLEQDTNQLNQAIEASNNFIQEWNQSYTDSTGELAAAQEQFDFLFNLQDMSKEKVPQLFKAFDEFTDVVDEYRALVIKNLQNVDGQSYEDLNQQFHEVFKGEGLFLIADYARALNDVFTDVDENYINVEVIVTLAQSYFLSTHLSKEITTKYVSQIAYPFFKYKFLRTYLKYYVNASHDQPFQDDLFSSFNIDPSILCHMVLIFVKTTLQQIIQMNVFQCPMIQSLMAQIIKKTYEVAKEQNDLELQRQVLNLIKSQLEHLLKNSSFNCEILSYKKLHNLLQFKGLLPPKNLNDCIAQTLKELKQAFALKNENTQAQIIDDVHLVLQNQNLWDQFSYIFDS